MFLIRIHCSLLHFLVHGQVLPNLPIQRILCINLHILCIPSPTNSQDNSSDNFRNKNTKNTNPHTGSSTNENRNHDTDDEFHEPMTTRMIESMTMVSSGTTILSTTMMPTRSMLSVWTFPSSTWRRQRFHPSLGATNPVSFRAFRSMWRMRMRMMMSLSVDSAVMLR